MNNHRITECFGLEGTFRGHLAQPPAVISDIFNYIGLLRAPSKLDLNVSRDGASTTSLGNLSQCFTTLIVKNNFFLISRLNLLSFSLKPLLLVLSQQASFPVISVFLISFQKKFTLHKKVIFFFSKHHK